MKQCLAGRRVRRNSFKRVPAVERAVRFGLPLGQRQLHKFSYCELAKGRPVISHCAERFVASADGARTLSSGTIEGINLVARRIR